jgi:hypothetical protein
MQSHSVLAACLNIARLSSSVFQITTVQQVSCKAGDPCVAVVNSGTWLCLHGNANGHQLGGHGRLTGGRRRIL